VTYPGLNASETKVKAGLDGGTKGPQMQPKVPTVRASLFSCPNWLGKSYPKIKIFLFET
jgi:hypothetical protein